jgi:hypothetical protein
MPSLATDLETVTGLAEAELEPLWLVENTELLVAAMYEVLPGAVENWSLAAQAVAAEWYDQQREQAEVAGTFEAIVEPIQDLGVYALVGWAAEPLLRPEPDIAAAKYRTLGGAQKRVANSANYTITGSSDADPQSRGWVRTTRPDACDFCKMVASKDVVYREAAARFACHDNCYCSARPIFGGESKRVRKYTPSERNLNLDRLDRADGGTRRQDLNDAARAWIKANLK